MRRAFVRFPVYPEKFCKYLTLKYIIIFMISLEQTATTATVTSSMDTAKKKSK